MKKDKKLSRRDFIKLSSLASASLPMTLSGFHLFASNQPEDYVLDLDNENVVVLIQLQGGNDGLNTIFDLNQYDNLQAVRSNIIIPEYNLIPVNDSISFHPSLEGLKEVLEKEKLSIIQNVGYPNQNRSHFRSTDIWNSASSANELVTSGWIGRFFNIDNDTYPKDYPNDNFPDPFAVTVGRVISETCQGYNTNFSIALPDAANPGTAIVSSAGSIPDNCYGNELIFINDTITQVNGYAEVIKTAYNKGNNLSDKYSNSELAQKLKDVARLISGGLKTKVYVVQLAGFDTHIGQSEVGAPEKGWHAYLLKVLSDAIAAFQDDLELLDIDSKVIGMTYSEFGRRIRSNSGLGTDHGTAAPLFVFGSCAKNQILGDSPVIGESVDVDEGVPMQYDFRNIYRTILTDWLGATSSKSDSILFNNFDALPIFKEGCSAYKIEEDVIDNLEINLYPNPTTSLVNIKYYSYDYFIPVILTLYNSIGALVMRISNKKHLPGGHTISVDVQSLSSGSYFVHYQSGGVSKTKKFIKY